MGNANVENQEGLEITSLGIIYKGPWDKKYWSTSRGKDRFPYPIGYCATRNHAGETYRMEVKEGDRGPLFQVTSSTGDLCCGPSPNIAWRQFQKKIGSRVKRWPNKRFSCATDGAKIFGFKYPPVQKLLQELATNFANVTEKRSTISFICDRSSTEVHGIQDSSSCTDPSTSLRPGLERDAGMRKENGSVRRNNGDDDQYKRIRTSSSVHSPSSHKNDEICNEKSEFPLCDEMDCSSKYHEHLDEQEIPSHYLSNPYYRKIIDLNGRSSPPTCLGVHNEEKPSSPLNRDETIHENGGNLQAKMIHTPASNDGRDISHAPLLGHLVEKCMQGRIGISNAFQDNPFDSSKQELAKSMIAVFLPQAIPLMKKPDGMDICRKKGDISFPSTCLNLADMKDAVEDNGCSFNFTGGLLNEASTTETILINTRKMDAMDTEMGSKLILGEDLLCGDNKPNIPCLRNACTEATSVALDKFQVDLFKQGQSFMEDDSLIVEVSEDGPFTGNINLPEASFIVPDSLEGEQFIEQGSPEEITSIVADSFDGSYHEPDLACQGQQRTKFHEVAEPALEARAYKPSSKMPCENHDDLSRLYPNDSYKIGTICSNEESLVIARHVNHFENADVDIYVNNETYIDRKHSKDKEDNHVPDCIENVAETINVLHCSNESIHVDYIHKSDVCLDSVVPSGSIVLPQNNATLVTIECQFQPPCCSPEMRIHNNMPSSGINYYPQKKSEYRAEHFAEGAVCDVKINCDGSSSIPLLSTLSMSEKSPFGQKTGFTHLRCPHRKYNPILSENIILRDQWATCSTEGNSHADKICTCNEISSTDDPEPRSLTDQNTSFSRIVGSLTNNVQFSLKNQTVNTCMTEGNNHPPFLGPSMENKQIEDMNDLDASIDSLKDSDIMSWIQENDFLFDKKEENANFLPHDDNCKNSMHHNNLDKVQSVNDNSCVDSSEIRGLEASVELLGCYSHPYPVISVMLNRIGDDIQICVLCGLFEDSNRTFFMYKVTDEKQSVTCPSFLGYTSMTMPSTTAYSSEAPFEQTGLQCTSDGRFLVLLNSIKTPYCSKKDIRCLCATCASDNWEQNGVKVVCLNYGYVTLVTRLQSAQSVLCVLICEPNYIISVDFPGTLHVWTMDTSWSVGIEDFILPTFDFANPFILEIRKFQSNGDIIVGHNGGGGFGLWDIHRRSLLAKFFVQGYSFSQIVPICLFDWTEMNSSTINPRFEDHIEEIITNTENLLSGYQEKHTSFPSKSGSIVTWLLVSAIPENEVPLFDHEKHTNRDTIRGWRLVVLVDNKVIVGRSLDPRASVTGTLSGCGIIGTLDGHVYAWELSTGARLAAFHHFENGAVSCIAVDEKSGALAITSDDGQLLLYRTLPKSWKHTHHPSHHPQ